jgi:hypothetical protein
MKIYEVYSIKLMDKRWIVFHKIPSVKIYPITDFDTWVVVAFMLCFFFLPLFVSAESEERGSGAREIRA